MDKESDKERHYIFVVNYKICFNKREGTFVFYGIQVCSFSDERI